MTLVPIIYTSLILFFGLLMVVIIISYISFKSKAKVNPLIAEQIRNANHNSAPRPIINHVAALNSQIEEQFEYHKRNVTYRNQRQAEPKSVILPADYFDAPRPNISVAIKNRPSFSSAIHESGENHKDNRKTKTRIEIMNKPLSQTKAKGELQYKERSRSVERDISHFNILSFYSDDDDADFVSLTPFKSKQV